MNSSAKLESRRIWSLDLLRGLMIGLMTLSHTIHFTRAYHQPLLGMVNSVINLTSFTTFLFVSAAVGYLSYINQPPAQTQSLQSRPWFRLIKRLFVYLIGYYLIANWASLVLNNFQLLTTENQQLTTILTFRTLVPFTEFIIPFLIFGLLTIPLRPLYQRLAKSPVAIALLSISAYLLGEYLYLHPSPHIPSAWQAIIYGYSGLYSFPLLQYFPVYLLGLHLGYSYLNDSIHKSSKLINLFKLLVLLNLFSLIISLLAHPGLASLLNRWPPTIPFLLTGLTLTFLLLSLIHQLRQLQNFPWTRTLLLILGQNSFAVFFTYTFLDYLLAAFHLPALYSPLLVLTLWVILLTTAIYLAKIIPLNWQFELTLVNWCECQLTHCTHAQEHRFVVKIKSLVLRLVRFRDLFSITISGHRLRLIKKRQFALGFLLVLFSATTLGLGENYQYLASQVAHLQGQSNRTWFLTTDPQPQLIYTLSFPSELQPQQVTAVLNNHSSFPMTNPCASQPSISNINCQSPNVQWYTVTVPLTDLSSGTYQIQGRLTFFKTLNFLTTPTTFYISQPLYVTWTIDWEGYDVSDDYLTELADIADQYHIPMTHMFNPYIYIYPSLPETQRQALVASASAAPTNSASLLANLTPERADYLTHWVIQRRDLHQEEIGLHLHMYPELAADAKVQPRLEPTWGGGFTPGYDILTTDYTREEMTQILERAKGWFVSRDLGVPKSYRAGAWFANLDTLQALQDTGFLIDSSGRTSYTFGTNHIQGPWHLSSTTQPYYPSLTDQNQPASVSTTQSSNDLATQRILEIPNNGADTYAFNTDQLISRFTDNFTGEPLTQPQQVTYLSHPHWFYPSRQQTIRQVFDYLHQFNYSEDSGPVVYTTLLGVYNAFK